MDTDWKSLRSSSKKGLAGLVGVFFLIQVFTDLFHSVTAFPFVHYGMFSETFALVESLPVYEVVVDGRPLDPRDFRIYRWDMIQQPLAAFARETATRDFSDDRQRIRNALGIHSVTPSVDPSVISSVVPGNAPSLAADFPGWYRNYLGRILGRPIGSLEVNRCIYRWNGSQCILQTKTPWIAR